VKRLKNDLARTEKELGEFQGLLEDERLRAGQLALEVNRLEVIVRSHKKTTADASVDTYGEFDDFSRMRDRLRDATEKNAALVLECTNLRMKSWQDEERVTLARRSVEDALSDVKTLEGKLDASQRALFQKDQRILDLEFDVHTLVCTCDVLTASCIKSSRHCVSLL
jgi:chromosome segregation ATPase